MVLVKKIKRIIENFIDCVKGINYKTEWEQQNIQLDEQKLRITKLERALKAKIKEKKNENSRIDK